MEIPRVIFPEYEGQEVTWTEALFASGHDCVVFAVKTFFFFAATGIAITSLMPGFITACDAINDTRHVVSSSQSLRDSR